jgi:hypothetical protein
MLASIKLFFMSYNTKNIITEYTGAEDDIILVQLLVAFKHIQVKTFEAGFKGLVAQLDAMKIHKTITNEDEVYELIAALEDGIEDFSRKFSHKKFAFIEADCFGGACIYFGFVMQNGEILFGQSYDHSGHIPLLQAINPAFEGHYFEPFTRDFFVKQGDIKGMIYDFSMAGLFVALNEDYRQHPDFELLIAPTEYVLRPRNQNYYLHFIEQANREIQIIGIMYQLNDSIIKQIGHLVEDALYGLNYTLEIRDLDKIRLRLAHP